MSTVAVDPDDIRAVAGLLNAAQPMLFMVPGFAYGAAACNRLMQAAASAGLPADPVSGMTVAAISVHEVMLAYEGAGFTREEAFDLTKIHVVASANANTGSPGA